MKVHHRKQENGTSLKTGFSYITLRYITDVKWGVMCERKSGNPQEGGRKRALPCRSHEEQYIDLTCHIISVHKTIEKKFKCNKCPYISAYSLAMD